jgi:hypothetical protein
VYLFLRQRVEVLGARVQRLQLVDGEVDVPSAARSARIIGPQSK